MAPQERTEPVAPLARLAAGLAHDFGNLLSAINGFSELLLDDQGLTEEQRSQLQHVHGAGQRAAAIVRQLRAFAHRQLARPMPVDVADLLKAQRRLFERIVAAEGTFTLDIDGALPLALVDGPQLEHALLNAVTQLGAHGPLTIELRPALNIGGGSVLLRLLSPTLHLTEEERSLLLEPYGSAYGGLDLAALRGVVELQGGSVRVRQAGFGTAVELLLPIASDDAPAPRRSSSISALRGHERVLVVDDDGALRALISTLLQRAGYSVSSANGPRNVLVQPSMPPTDVVVLDLRLAAGGTLPAAVQSLLSMGAGLPFVIIVSPAERAQVEGLPGVWLVDRPFRPAELLHQVRAALAEDTACSIAPPAQLPDLDARLAQLFVDPLVRREVALAFRERSPLLVDALREGADRGQSLELVLLARELAETSAVFGATELVTRARLVERDARHGQVQLDDVLGLADAHQALMAAVRVYLER